MNTSFEEHSAILEKQWNKIQKRWSVKWNFKIYFQKDTQNHYYTYLTESDNKQKETLKDIFAGLTEKRIFFQKNKRYQYTIGANKISSHLFEKIKFADVILQPIHVEEILNIFRQAQEHHILIRIYHPEIQLIPNKVSQKIYAIIDLQAMQKILKLDIHNETVHVQTGIFAQDLINFLSEKGLEPFQQLDIWNRHRLLDIFRVDSIFRKQILQGIFATPAGIVEISKQDNPLISLFTGSKNLGSVATELCLKVRKKPKHIRVVCGILPHYEAVLELLKLLHESSTNIDSMGIFNFESPLLDLNLSDYKLGIRTLNTLFKSPEKLFAKEDFISEQSMGIYIKLYEYQHSQSAALIRIKDLIVQTGGALSEDLSNQINTFMYHFGSLKEQAVNYQTDAFHFHTILPVDKIEHFEKSIHARLKKSSYYKGNKQEYLLHFTPVENSYLQADFYLLAPIAFRKEAHSALLLTKYFKDFFQEPIEENSLPENINNVLLKSLKQKIDPQGILSEETFLDF